MGEKKGSKIDFFPWISEKGGSKIDIFLWHLEKGVSKIYIFLIFPSALKKRGVYTAEPTDQLHIVSTPPPHPGIMSKTLLDPHLMTLR